MEKVNVLQIKNYITQILRDKIFDGSIKDGDELTQENIAEQLGVSRMPVREAFQLLEQEGYLQRLPNRRMKVNGISKEGILVNLKILSSIEKEISLLIIEYNKDITPIKKSLDGYKKIHLEANIEKEICIEKEVDFHQKISSVLEDRYVQSLHQKLIEGYFTHAIRNIDYDTQLSIQNLENIIKCIENKESKKLDEKFNTYYIGISQSIIEELNNE